MRRLWSRQGGGGPPRSGVPGPGRRAPRSGGARNWGMGEGGFNREGSMVATAGSDGTARLWDATDLRPLSASSEAVRTASFSPDGRFIVVAGDDGTARILSARGRLLHVLRH